MFIFAAKIHFMKMTALQLNAEIYQAMGIISEDENLLSQAARYLKRLAAKKKDETLMSRQEFFAMLDRAEQGESHAMLPGEDLTHYLRRRGYDL